MRSCICHHCIDRSPLTVFASALFTCFSCSLPSPLVSRVYVCVYPSSPCACLPPLPVSLCHVTAGGPIRETPTCSGRTAVQWEALCGLRWLSLQIVVCILGMWSDFGCVPCVSLYGINAHKGGSKINSQTSDFSPNPAQSWTKLAMHLCWFVTVNFLCLPNGTFWG